MTQLSIEFSGLYVPLHVSEEGESDRGPLTILDDDEHSHIHGMLLIRINGHELPAVSHYGPDDACMGQWVAELHAAAETLQATDPAIYVYDEGEQGQPAFVFERSGETVCVSMRRSQYESKARVPPWIAQSCPLVDFVAEVQAFMASLDAAVRSATPAGLHWVQVQLKEAR